MGRQVAMPLATIAAVGIVAQDQKRQADCGFFGNLFGPNLTAVKKDIVDIMEAEEAKRGDGTSPGPTFVRLAWHASGTYCKADKTGGSNGSHMRMAPENAWGCNAGLAGSRDLLAPVAKKHGMSVADVWTLAGATAVEQMGGPTIQWKAGRTDSDKPTTVPDGRLPDADNGGASKDCAHIRKIFGRMGFNDREMVALSGAHALGRCHTNASGYTGPWTFAETTFSNEYFRLLVEEKWTKKTRHEGKKWTGPEQYEDKTGTLMMLPTDMALLTDPEFKKWVDVYAKDEKAFFDDFSKAFAKLLALGVTEF
jgi:cytochrome c peroxidase